MRMRISTLLLLTLPLFARAQWAPLPSPPPDAALLERNLPSQSGVVARIPANTFVPAFEDESGTVINWTAPNGNADNMLRFPEDLSQAAWVKSNATAVASSVTFPSQQNGLAVSVPMYTVTTSIAAGNVNEAVTVGTLAVATSFTASAFVAASTGTVVETVGGFCGTGSATVSACVRSDGGVCTATSAATNAWAYGSFGTTPVRMSVTFSCAAGTSVGAFVHDGQYNSTFGVGGLFGGVQLVRDIVSHPYKSPPVANLLASPSSFDNTAAWTAAGTGAAAPTVTSNAGLALDGSMNAEQIAIPAVAAAQKSTLAQTFTGAAVSFTYSVWLKKPTAGTANVYIFLNTGATYNNQLCAVTTSWSKCSISATLTAATWTAAIGTDLTAASGQSATAAATVLAWNAAVTRADMNGDNFVQNGTIPVQTVTAAYPKGFGGARKFVDLTGNAGVATKGFRWSSPLTGFDTNGFTVCIAYNVLTPNPGYDPVMVAHGQSAAAGWYLTLNRVPPNHTFGITGVSTLGGANGIATVNQGSPGVLNIACAGLDSTGTILYTKLNGGTTQSVTMPASIASAACYPLLIGHYVAYPGAGCSGAPSAQSGDPDQIAEVWYTSTPWTEANVAAIQASAMANGSGPLFTDDSNTKFHAIADSFAGGAAAWGTPHVSLTNIGTAAVSTTPVPQQTASSDALGAFSDVNYESLGAGLDVMDFSGDFSCHVAFAPPASVASQPVIISAANAGTTVGWLLQINSGGGMKAFSNSSFLTTSNTVAAGLNVASVGRSGGSMFLKLNLGPTASAASTITPDTSDPTLLGRFATPGLSFAGSLYGVLCTLTPWAETSSAKIQNRMLQQTTASGVALTTTRATPPASYEVAAGATPPSLFYAPANIARITPTGMLVEPAATNLILQSEALDTAITWVTTGTCTVLANQGIFADGQTSMEAISCSGAGFTDTQNQAVTVASSTGPWTASMWSAGAAGAATSITMTMGAGNATGCTCVVTDGTACTATTAGAVGYAYMTHTGTLGPDRLILTCSSTLATTSVTVGVHPGQYAVSNVAGQFGGVQLETGAFATSYVPTAAVTATRNADVVTIANPLASSDSRWCVAGTWQPESGRAWNQAVAKWLAGAGTSGAANSMRVFTDTTTGLVFDVFDAAAGQKTATLAHGFTAGSSHKVAACDSGGTLSIYADGVITSPTITGAGTGVIGTMPATVSFTNATQEFGGTARDFRVCRGSQAVQDCALR